MTHEPALEGPICTLEDVLITEQLARRPSRAHDFEAEARALGVLARELANDARGLMHRVAATALTLCRADSAGVSVLERDGEHEVFRWHAVAGALAARAHRTIPRDASPCGVVVRRDEPVLFDRAGRHFRAMRDVEPESHEQLIAPWRIDGRPAGTLWVIAHTPDRHFDAEDARALTSLASFAAAAWQTVLALEAVDAVRSSEHARAKGARETALRESDARQLALAEEEQRRRLARELHDEVGQHLTALGLGLRALSDVAPPGSEVDRRATQLQSLADTLGRELHAIAVRLRPRALDDFGLEAALQSYAEEWSRQSGIPLHLHARGGSERLPPEVESAIYRIVQEALTNVARHSGATRAAVVLERRGGHIHVVVEDDGHGFEPASVPAGRERGPALGLMGIRERTALAGGTMDIESTPSAGTTLFVHLPIERDATND